MQAGDHHRADVRKEDAERFGEIVSIAADKAVLKIPRDRVKSVASEIPSASLPVDDILINEMEVDDVIRIIFNKAPSGRPSGGF